MRGPIRSDDLEKLVSHSSIISQVPLAPCEESLLHVNMSTSDPSVQATNKLTAADKPLVIQQELRSNGMKSLSLVYVHELADAS